MKLFRSILHLLYQPYKWLFYVPFFFINTTIFGIIAVIVASLVNQRIGSYWGGVVWSRFNSALVPMFVKVKGKENIQAQTSYIVLSNHQSVYDIFLVYGWLGVDLKWVMKKELSKIPGVGFGSKKVGHIFLDRSNKRAAVESMESAKKKLVNGTSVVIFPEGTRSNDGILLPFKRGAFKLAIELELPILPISVINTRKIMPNKTMDIFPGKVEMVVHPPIKLDGYNENNMGDLIVRVKDQIASALPEMN